MSRWLSARLKTLKIKWYLLSRSQQFVAIVLFYWTGKASSQHWLLINCAFSVVWATESYDILCLSKHYALLFQRCPSGRMGESWPGVACSRRWHDSDEGDNQRCCREVQVDSEDNSSNCWKPHSKPLLFTLHLSSERYIYEWSQKWLY